MARNRQKTKKLRSLVKTMSSAVFKMKEAQERKAWFAQNILQEASTLFTIEKRTRSTLVTLAKLKIESTPSMSWYGWGWRNGELQVCDRRKRLTDRITGTILKGCIVIDMGTLFEATRGGTDYGAGQSGWSGGHTDHTYHTEPDGATPARDILFCSCDVLTFSMLHPQGAPKAILNSSRVVDEALPSQTSFRHNRKHKTLEMSSRLLSQRSLSVPMEESGEEEPSVRMAMVPKSEVGFEFTWALVIVLTRRVNYPLPACVEGGRHRKLATLVQIRHSLVSIDS
ncbi:hypothetical protein B0H13DRAFT_1851516 [Mycena leptocephala]|nr:hypothetical protein B0H13DRAFT_1851516 [Mycena leptocephala]